METRKTKQNGIGIKKYLAVTITIGNLILGFNSIFLAIQGNFLLASLFILLASVLDGMDGMLARKLKITGDFGAQMDSLADLITFVSAPSILLFTSYKDVVGLPYIVIVTAIFYVCGTWRLARFNTSPKDYYFFQGLSTTAAACIFLVYFIFLRGNIFLLPFMALLGILMVTNIKYPKIYLLFKFRKYLSYIFLLFFGCYALMGINNALMFSMFIYLVSGFIPNSFFQHILRED